MPSQMEQVVIAPIRLAQLERLSCGGKDGAVRGKELDSDRGDEFMLPALAAQGWAPGI